MNNIKTVLYSLTYSQVDLYLFSTLSSRYEYWMSGKLVFDESFIVNGFTIADNFGNGVKRITVDETTDIYIEDTV